MLINRINEFIDKNADFIIINRSIPYHPILIETQGQNFKFKCQGTGRTPYDVNIKIDKYHNINSRCSCPYDYAGLCKHQVAALNQLIQMIKKGKIKLDDIAVQKIPQSKDIVFAHNNGLIDREKVAKITFDNRNFDFGKLFVNEVNKHSIKADYTGYKGSFDLEYKYDEKKDEIRMSCTCKNTQNCYHKYMFIEHIIDNFNLDYFSSDFKETLKDNALLKNGLKGKVDFDDIYKLSISTAGIEILEKKKNFLVDPNSIFDPYEVVDNQDVYKPYPTEEDIEFGLGFCIEFHQKELYSIFPFYGKLNKNKTDIVSKTKEINEVNLADVMIMIRKEDSSLLPICIDLSAEFTASHRYFGALEPLVRFQQLFKRFRKEYHKKIFAHNDKKSFVKKNLYEVNIIDNLINPILLIKQNDKFLELTFKINIDAKTYQLDSSRIKITPLGVFINYTLYTVESPQVLLSLLKFKKQAKFTLFNEGEQYLKENIIKPYSKIFDINYKGLTEKKSTKKTLKPIKQVFLSDADDGEYVVFQPIVSYGQNQVKPMSSEKIWLDQKNLMSLKRDRDIEANFLNDIQTLHPDFEDKSDYFFIKTEKALDSLWLIESIDQLKQNDVQVYGLKELNKIKFNLNKPTFSMGLSSGTDWFDMEIDIAFGDQKVDLKKLQKAVLKNSNYVELKDGSLGVVPKKWIEKYQKYFKLGQVKKNEIEISNYNFNIIDELYEDLDNSPDFLKKLHDTKKRILNLKDLKTVKPSKNIKATLRPYQKEGLNWMVFLHENKLGGCLADDMGLGKTLQSIAFLQHLKDQAQSKPRNPTLIVAPTSLMFNWINEFKKFAPKLKTLTFTGSHRDDLKPEFENVDVVMTTYGSLIKDIEFHKTQTYHYVILDESQAIKNPNSQRFKAVRLLNCYNRLALTGTPIENNTFDLYSQFNFINPGIFGSVKHFRSTFSDAIDKEQDEDTSALLSSMIKPFILRRTKTQVAKELPSKTEAVIYCEMGKEQRQVYDQFKAYFRQKLKEQIESEGINRSQVYILQGLTKLRQICNSTALADKEKDYGIHSTKLDELTRHLKEKVNNHKVLVFSQFVGMLNLVKDRLDQEQINFEYLDGQTRDREDKVNRFQNDDDVRVFLISLKAGGTGLNLTEAGYVYLIDPWWNPAVESQAIDRCYRIGQSKKVLAYRMICKDSIEEKIVALQDKKKTVASEVIRTDLEKKSFDKKDLEKFFGD